MKCQNGMALMEADTVDLVVTSPPYDNLRTYNDSSEWNFESFKEVAHGITRVLKTGGVCMWNVGDAVVDGSETLSSFRQAIYFKDECGLNMHDVMIYQKPSAAYPASANSNRYSQVFEYCFILSKGKPKTSNLIKDKKNAWAGTKNWGTSSSRQKDGSLKKGGSIVVDDYGYRDNIWRITNTYGFGQASKGAHSHPATMPEQLAKDHILTWSNKGDLVLDPFMGSGTTARMAYQLDRDWIGFEIDATYYELCKELTVFNNVFELSA